MCYNRAAYNKMSSAAVFQTTQLAALVLGALVFAMLASAPNKKVRSGHKAVAVQRYPSMATTVVDPPRSHSVHRDDRLTPDLNAVFGALTEQRQRQSMQHPSVRELSKVA